MAIGAVSEFEGLAVAADVVVAVEEEETSSSVCECIRCVLEM